MELKLFSYFYTHTITKKKKELLNFVSFAENNDKKVFKAEQKSRTAVVNTFHKISIQYLQKFYGLSLNNFIKNNSV